MWFPDLHQEQKTLFEEAEIREASTERAMLGTREPTCGREGT